MNKAQVMRFVPAKHREKVEDIEFYPGGFAIWLKPEWTFEVLDNNRGVEHYNFDDAEYEGWEIKNRVKDDFASIEKCL